MTETDRTDTANVRRIAEENPLRPEMARYALHGCADALDEAAARLEAQSRALTASQEAIDRMQSENERLRKALEQAVEDSDDNGREMVCWWVDDARAALHPEGAS